MSGEGQPGVTAPREPGPRRGELARLLRCLESPFPAVRIHGLRWAAVESSKAAESRVVELLGDADREVRREAVRTAGARALTDAVGPLVELLDDPDPRLQLDAAAALERIGGGGGDPDSPRASAQEAPPVRGRAGGEDRSGRVTGAGAPAQGDRTGATPAEGATEPRERPPPGRRSLRTPEAWILVALLGFLVGRYLPEPRDATPASEQRALDALFPDSHPYSRIGRGAYLARQEDPQGLVMILQAYDELMWGLPRPLTFEDRPAATGELQEDPWPNQGEGEDLDAPDPDPGPAPMPPPTPEPPSPARMLPPATAAPTPPVDPPAASRAPAAPWREPRRPSPISDVERHLYLEAAYRYLEAGDRQRARELLGRVGRAFPEDPDVQWLSRRLGTARR